MLTPNNFLKKSLGTTVTLLSSFTARRRKGKKKNKQNQQQQQNPHTSYKIAAVKARYYCRNTVGE